MIEVGHHAARLCSTEARLSKLRVLEAKGEIPSSLKQSAPVLQFSKTFTSSAEGLQIGTQVAEKHKAYQREVFALEINGLTSEIAHLKVLLDPETMFKRALPIVEEVHISETELHRLPVFHYNDTGRIINTTWEESKEVSSVYQRVKRHVAMYGSRIVSIERAKYAALARKRDAKKKAATAADVEMSDRPDALAGPSTSTIQSAVDKAVSATLKKMKRNDKVSTSPAIPLTGSSDVFTTESRKGFEEYEQAHIDAAAFETSQERLNQGCSQQVQKAGQRERKRKRESSKEMSDYRYGHPDSIPDHVLMLPYPDMIDYLILRTPIDVILASQFKYSVHLSDGVSLPYRILQMLSTGMNFMFFTPRDSSLVRKAWQDFNRRLHYRIKSALEGDESFYDPDYDVRKDVDKTTSRLPVLPHYISLGIVKGRQYINSYIASKPDYEPLDRLKTINPDLGELKKWMLELDLIITNTDKNLGIAVSDRTWYIEQCLNLLSDRNTYRKIEEYEEAHVIYRNKAIQLKEIIERFVADDKCQFWIDGPKDEDIIEFLRSQVKIDGRGYEENKKFYPTFYGLPKIHKTPVAMRPIVPCHSVVIGPPAKYVSKQLKPLVDACPTIIKGTKDLAQKLSKLQLDKTRRWYLVTGDVVAFYTNINLKRCIEIVTDMYQDYYLNVAHQVKDHHDRITMHTWRLLLFKRLLELGNTNLVFQFENEFYEQVSGLAMGVADSPDLANLFGYYFEKLADVQNDSLIPYYGRYIDDIFSIVFASSEDEACEYMDKKIVFDGCKIKWSASAHHQVFLDMTLYRDVDNTLQHMPYRKNRSHQERIPWISHHPLNVKRGTFISEMSRLAVLSSKWTHYTEALVALVALYVTRGYPRPLVVKWMKDNITKRWTSRLEKPKEHEPVLVLKSYYNSIWDSFNARELQDTIFGYWREWIERAKRGEYSSEYPMMDKEVTLELFGTTDPRKWATVVDEDSTRDIPDITKTDILDRRLLVSKRRNKQLKDVASLWKNIVLSRVDEDTMDNPLVSRSSSIHPMDVVQQEQISAERSSDSEEDVINVHRRSSSPGMGKGWWGS